MWDQILPFFKTVKNYMKKGSGMERGSKRFTGGGV